LITQGTTRAAAPPDHGEPVALAPPEGDGVDGLRERLLLLVVVVAGGVPVVVAGEGATVVELTVVAVVALAPELLL
jgi:hypothetical protein